MFSLKFLLLTFSEDFISWPTLFLEILSVDQLERFRTEGYGYITLPNKAGTHDITVNTWRPTGNGLAPKMRPFFIGGSPELEDVTYVKQPAGSEDVRVYFIILFLLSTIRFNHLSKRTKFCCLNVEPTFEITSQLRN